MSYSPVFEESKVEGERQDGYWLEPCVIDDKHAPGLVGYGLSQGNVNIYHNPGKPASGALWKKTEIQKLNSPVGMDQADLTGKGDGKKDIIICFDYGATMYDCNPEGGKICWLENPRSSTEEHWKQRYIGKAPSMHRLRVGHFSHPTKWQVMGLPIVAGPQDRESPVPVYIFTQPDDIYSASEWEVEVVHVGKFHIIHDAVVWKNNKNDSQELQKVLVASEEGINWLYYADGTWHIKNVGKGEQFEFLFDNKPRQYKGSGCVDFGRVGKDNTAYIATVEPFHGNVLAVYVKDTNRSALEVTWKRVILDIYGPLNENGEGPAHYVACGDFDKDGDDEFIVALRGPDPWVGVFYYKAVDIEKGIFHKWHVSKRSAARIAVADFDGDGFLDFATIGYYVPGYFQTPDPSIYVYYNRFAGQHLYDISVRVDPDFGLKLVVPFPRNSKIISLPVMSIGGIQISVEVLPPHYKRQIQPHTGIKVLAGNIEWTEGGTKHSRARCVQPKEVTSIALKPDSNFITSPNGAIYVAFNYEKAELPKFTHMNQVAVKNLLPEGTVGRTYKFKWTKVEDLIWGGDFIGVDFWNLPGFEIYYPTGQDLCNIQYWTAGKGVNCGMHNHSSNAFCEIHACIVNGTDGGMVYANHLNNDIKDEDLVKLVVPTYYEHGPIWDIPSDDMPVNVRPNGSVVYPTHKWQSESGDSYDLWAAFEFDPAVVIKEHREGQITESRPTKAGKIHQVKQKLNKKPKKDKKGKKDKKSKK